MTEIAAALIIAGAIFGHASSSSADRAGRHTGNSKVNAWLFVSCWVLALAMGLA